MTREEQDNAIKVLRNFDLNNPKVNLLLFSAEEITNAFDMAIKALEQERSRSAEITQYRHDCEKLMEENERLKKALEQEPVLDKIRAEIETDLSHFCFDDWGNETTEWKEVKAIIDKYKTESK